MINAGQLASVGTSARYWAGYSARPERCVFVTMPRETSPDEGQKAAIEKLLRDHPAD